MLGHKRTESVKQTPGQQPCNEREPPCLWPEKGWVSVICRERAWLLAPQPSAAHGGSYLASFCSFSLAQVPAKANPDPYQESRGDLWPVTEWLGIASDSQLTVCPTLRSRTKYVLVFFSFVSNWTILYPAYCNGHLSCSGYLTLWSLIFSIVR